MNALRVLLALATSLSLVACGPPPPPHYGPGGGGPGVGPSGKPHWVDGQSVRYPDLHYLRGVGRGPTRGQCDADAHAALAKIFNAKIQQVSTDWQAHFSQVSNLGPSVKVEAMSIEQITRVSTDKVLKGVKIAEHWEGEGTHHCLAVLERLPTAASLREEIGRLDGEIKAQLERGDGAATPTARFMAYARAMEVMQEREALNVDLRIVDPRGVGLPPPISWGDLVAKFTQSRESIKIGLRLTGSKASTIQTCLAEKLTAQGIRVEENTSDVDMVIHGTIKHEKSGFIAGSHMVRATVNLRINDAESGRTMAAFSEQNKVGRPTLERAVQLSIFKLCEKVVPSLVQKIRASFGK